MFHWHKEMERLDIPAPKVRRLYRSLGDVQVALPGLPSQQATAYLCAFAVEKGFRVAVALHLLASHRLAFYLHEQETVQKEQVSRILNEGIGFAESMGFMLGDLDIQLLDPQERVALWESLPLKMGDAASAPPPSPAPAEAAPAATEPESGRAALSPGLLRKRPPTPEEMAAKRKKLLENLGRFLASF